MSRTRVFLLVAALLGLPAASSLLAQRRPASVERGSIWDDPRLRERLYSRNVERYARELAEAYELTDAQKEQVNARLAELKAEQVAYSQRIREEMGEATRELGDLWRRRQAGDSVDEQRIEQLAGRTRELWEASPLLNSRHVAAEVEKLLPADQVTRGRAKWEVVRQERIRMAMDGMSLRGRGRPDADEPLDAWERFVETFCSEFGLDEAQRAAAMSVLRDVKARRDQYRRRHADDFESLQQIEDFVLQAERRRQLMQPIDVLEEELRSRLDRIPTSSQIDAVRQRAATQPARDDVGRGPDRPRLPDRARAGSAGRFDPATATRPSDMIRRDSGSRRVREFPPMPRTRPTAEP